MSGGAWNYQEYRLQEKADMLTQEIAELLRAVAATEHLVDWSESGDSSRAYAEPRIYDVWLEVFERLYHDHG